MAKIYPFKYRFENKGIQPLYDSLWFKSHQELLLRIANTPQGRDLLCIDKDFNGIPIVGFAKNRVTGLLDYSRNKAILKSDFRVGTKWANVIRYRWPEFVKLAREHYSDQVNKQTEILLNGEHRMAATTSTFYPNADGDPSPTSVDGRLGHVESNQTWATILNGAGTFAFPSEAANAVIHYACGNAGLYSQITRSMILFDTSSLGGDTIDSATKSTYGNSKNNDTGESPDSNVYAADPASNTDLIASDAAKGNFGTTAFSDTTLTYANFTLGAYNDYVFNASGLAAIDGSGISKFSLRDPSYDVAENTPAHVVAESCWQNIIFADTAGTATDPKLVVVHSAAGGSNLMMMGIS